MEEGLTVCANPACFCGVLALRRRGWRLGATEKTQNQPAEGGEQSSEKCLTAKRAARRPYGRQSQLPVLTRSVSKGPVHVLLVRF